MYFKIMHNDLNPSYSCNAIPSLLDKVVCTVIGDFQVDQHHLMLKVSLKSSIVDQKRSQKEGDWNKTFLFGPIVWNKVISCFISPIFIMFLHIREMPTKSSNETWTENVRLDPQHVTRQGAVGKHIPCHYYWEYLHEVALWSLRDSVITCPWLSDPQYHVRSTFSMRVKNFPFFKKILQYLKKLQHGMKYYFTLWINLRFSTLLFQQLLTPKMIKLFYLCILREGPTYPTTDPFFSISCFYFKIWPKKPDWRPFLWEIPDRPLNWCL